MIGKNLNAAIKRILKFLCTGVPMVKLLRQNARLKKELSGQKQKFFRLRRESLYQQHQLDRANSCLEIATLDNERIKKSPNFESFRAIISELSPMDVSGGTYRRFGRNYDGGYVMLDDLSAAKIDAAYSFGISNDVSWDEDIAKLGIPVFMFDHTIEKLPKENPHFHFFKLGVTGKQSGENLDTLANLLKRNGHENSQNLILKMDIENCEWDVFQETPTKVINQFSQIVIEFHGLNINKSAQEISEITTILKKINQTHQSVHVHANTSVRMNWLGEHALPMVLEVTYVRRSDYGNRLTENTRTFPTEIDCPSMHGMSDVSLGTFSI